jgi:hypothetical protein
LADSTTVRAELAALLAPLLPKDWLIVPNERAIETANRTVLRLSQQSIQRHPQAPLGAVLVTFKAAVIDPGTDIERAEDNLDDAVTSLLFAIDALGGSVAWTDANKALFESNLGYEISLTVTVSKPQNPKEN